MTTATWTRNKQGDYFTTLLGMEIKLVRYASRGGWRGYSIYLSDVQLTTRPTLVAAKKRATDAVLTLRQQAGTVTP